MSAGGNLTKMRHNCDKRKNQILINKSSIKCLIISLLFAIFFSTVHYSFVYTDFMKVKRKIVDKKITPQNNVITIIIPVEEVQKIEIPIIELKIENKEEKGCRVKIFFNSYEAREVLFSSSGKKRIIIESDRKITSKSKIELKGNVEYWCLESLEIKNFYGFSKGIVTFMITNKAFSDYSSLPFFTSCILFLTLLFLGLFLEKGRQLSKNKLFKFIQISILLFFIIVILLPCCTKYKFLFQTKAFFSFLLIFYFPTLLNFSRSVYKWFKSISSEKSALLVSALVTTVIFLFFLLSMHFTLDMFERNYSGFIHLSKKFAKKNPILDKHEEIKNKLVIRDDGGYDGQFFYYIAFDPFLMQFKNKPQKYRWFIDSPPYRYGRIGFPLFIKLFSLNRPEWFPKTMVLLILFSHLVGAFFLTGIIRFYQKSPLWALFYLLVPGFHYAFVVALPESISSAFLLGGLYLYLKKKLPLSILLFSISILIRETVAIFIIIIALYEFFKNKDLKKSLAISLSIFPYFLWRIFLTWRLFNDYGWKTLFFSPGDFTIPFYGFFELFSAINKGNYNVNIIPAGISYPILLSIIFFLSLILLLRRRDILSMTFFAYSLLSISLNFHKIWCHVGNGERTTYETFIFLILSFVAFKKDVKHFIKYIIFIIFILIFIYNFHFFTLSKHFRAPFHFFLEFIYGLVQ